MKRMISPQFEEQARAAQKAEHQVNKEIAIEMLSNLSPEKRASLDKALSRIESLTSSYVFPSGKLDVYKEGFYLTLTGTRTDWSVWFWDNDGELVEDRKPYPNKINFLYSSLIQFNLLGEDDWHDFAEGRAITASSNSDRYDWEALKPDLVAEGLSELEIEELIAMVESGRTFDSALQDIEARWQDNSSTFYEWYDSLSEAEQSKVDDIADEQGIPLYDEASEADLGWLVDQYQSIYGSSNTYTEDDGYWYLSRHGVGPGCWPSGIRMLEYKEHPTNAYKCYVKLDRMLTTSELNEYQLKEEMPEGTDVNASTDSYANKIKEAITEGVKKYMTGPEGGFDAVYNRKDRWSMYWEDYAQIQVQPAPNEPDYIEVRVNAELSYDGFENMFEILNPIIESFDPAAYFDMEDVGRAVSYVKINLAEIKEGK